MVALIEMNHEEFTNWNERIWIAYRSELIKSGSTEVEAEQNVQLNISQTMPEGVPLAGNYIFNVHENEENVGAVWLNDRDSKWFIYDIEIGELHRGKGLGRATMQAIETFIKENGGTEISLSVFGFNHIARNLYESEGYEITRLALTKKLN